MADDDAPAPGGGGGFSLSKKYGPLPAWAWGLLGGAVVYAGWKFYQARKGGSAATTNTTADYGGIDYAPQIATLQTEIQNLQGRGDHDHADTDKDTGKDTDKDFGSKPSDNDGGGGGGGGGTKPTTNGTKTMPDLIGQRANFAIGELKSGYGIRATTVPVRNPRNEYKVTGQRPRAGARVHSGSTAVLRVKVSRRGAA